MSKNSWQRQVERERARHRAPAPARNGGGSESLSDDEYGALLVISQLDGSQGTSKCPGPIIVHRGPVIECVECEDIASHYHGPDAVEPCRVGSICDLCQTSTG